MISGHPVNLCLLLSIFLGDLTPCESLGENPIVKTRWATIKGLAQKVYGKSVNVYLGIPYAEAPVGHLRFREPLQIGELYNGSEYDATWYRPACMQSRSKILNKLANRTVDEDCLHLNIWVPGEIKADRALPIFFYVFGSGFIESSATNPSHHGDIVSTFMDVIFIAANYRLGAFGLAYGNNPEMPGNMAVDDVKMAFEWVRDHIHNFNGDPDRITLVGSSSGSMIASMLTLSPLMSPFLFDNLVLMSGVVVRPSAIESPQVAVNKAKLLAAKVGCGEFPNDNRQITPDQMECLRAVDAKVLANVQEDEDIIKLGHGPGIAFIPVYGTLLMPEPPDVVIKNHGVRRYLSILMGYDQNDDTISKTYLPVNKTDAISYLNQTLYQMVNITEENLTAFKNIIGDYFKGVDDGDIHGLRRSISEAIGDYVFHCPILLYAEQLSKFDPVHLYCNKYIADAYDNDRPLGPYHGDANFMFLGKPFREVDKFSNKDRRVSRRMIQIMGRFVRQSDLDWPPFISNDNQTIPIQWDIDSSVDSKNIEPPPENERCQQWKKILQIF